MNVLIADAAADAGTSGFSFFSFTIVGIPLVIVTIALAALLAPRVLPVRVSTSQPPDLSGYGATITEHYQLVDGFYRLRIREQSPLVGSPHDTWICRTTRVSGSSPCSGVWIP